MPIRPWQPDNTISSTEAGKSLSLSFFDDLGYSYTAKFGVHKTEADGEYYVTLDDITMHYVKYGETGEPLVLLHGNGNKLAEVTI